MVIAPDKFKGSLTAPDVAVHLARGLAAAVPGVRTEEIPVADGGDGTVDAAVAAGYRRVERRVSGPTGEPVAAAFALSGPGDVAVVEAAQACGLSRLPGGRLRPLTATSYGVGELIAAAVDAGARQIVLGLGGSATTDGGACLIAALGARLLAASGEPVPPGGAALAGLGTLDLSGLRDLSGVAVLLASDVDNPLLGPDGAAAVYGPQKGASAADIRVLEDGLARWADAAEAALGRGFGAGRGRARRRRDLPGRARPTVAGSQPRRCLRNGAFSGTGQEQARRAASGSRRWLSSARGCAPASRWCWIWCRSVSGWPGPAS